MRRIYNRKTYPFSGAKTITLSLGKVRSNFYQIKQYKIIEHRTMYLDIYNYPIWVFFCYVVLISNHLN